MIIYYKKKIVYTTCRQDKCKLLTVNSAKKLKCWL